MSRSVFLLITAVGSFCFGGMMFFIPVTASQILGIAYSQETVSVLRGMGGLIIGFGAINFLIRNATDHKTLQIVFLTNIIISLFGLLADFWGIYDGALTLTKMAPVELTHLFIGLGSLIFLTQLKTLLK